MVRVVIVSLSILFLLLFNNNAQAQTRSIEYGQVVTGEITDRQFEVPFEFSGKRGDIVIIEMKAVDSLGDLDNPMLILMDAQGRIIADTGDDFSIISALIAVQLTSNGRYTVIATRSDGRAGDSVGEFTLNLLKPSILEVDIPIADQISSDDRPAYYVIDSSIGVDRMLLVYQRQGDLKTEVTINVLSDTNGLDDMITFSGELLELVGTELSVEHAPYIVRIAREPFQFSVNPISANYVLTITSRDN